MIASIDILGGAASSKCDELQVQAVELAASILRDSSRYASRRERGQAAAMSRMMEDPSGKTFTTALSDEVLRIQEPGRAAHRLRMLIRDLGVPSYLTWMERVLMRFGAAGAEWFPGLVMPRLKDYVRHECEHVILPAENRVFHSYLENRRQDGVGVIVNQLGEAVLGEREAAHRLTMILERLRDPAVPAVSVKISSIASQIQLVGYEATLAAVQDRVRRLYEAAIEHGRPQPKFVNLDMEEYRDLHLTLDVFRRLLDERDFDGLEAGIVLQAYLPDSWRIQQELTQWARARYERTGASIKIRLVKGANLAMEQVEAARQGWPQAPYRSKEEVDANFKRMLAFGCRFENLQAVRLGVASHNLFDIAYAALLARRQGGTDRVDFEMLEGMSNSQIASVQAALGHVMVYAPVVHQEDFESAVAYLIRRLEENTSEENFLHDLFGLQENGPAWERQKTRFLAACATADSPELSSSPNRQQNRLTEHFPVDAQELEFRNTSDTDFTLPQNRAWVEDLFKRWTKKHPEDIPLQVAGSERFTSVCGEGRNPGAPEQVLYRYAVGGLSDVDEALDCAVGAQAGWEQRGMAERAMILRRVAAAIANHRDEAIGSMLLDAGKTVKESDPEVSEAVDFANYYARSLDDAGWHDGTSARALGVVVVTPPWNFPYAIPAGGCLAALMAGNSVILKPASDTVLTAWELARRFWEAGVPRDVLQFFPVADRMTRRKLITDERVSAVILTGAYETARRFRELNPQLRIFAETSGKNAVVITAAADWDLAIKDLVQSAFGHAGQKCSAASLALIEAAVYDSPVFRRRLKDAAESLQCGSPTDPSSVMTPVIRPPDRNLERALTTLDEGESWLVEPRRLQGNPCLWSPGVKLGVKAGSWFHRTECFGPVLGLMRVKDLSEAIAIQNSTAFGLTGGIHTLDSTEIEQWREAVEVGNAYINRGTTGAIVRRQPFGGWKNSAVGPGAKAGGPNYVAAFAHWRETALPTLRAYPDKPAVKLAKLVIPALDSRARERLVASTESYAYWWENEFSLEQDPSQVLGETNHYRYRQRGKVLLRLPCQMDAETRLDVIRVEMACRTCCVPLQMSMPKPLSWDLPIPIPTLESDRSLCDRIRAEDFGCLRAVRPLPDSVIQVANEENLTVYDEAVLANGRLELLRYLKEQSISETVHRHGLLRAAECRETASRPSGGRDGIPPGRSPWWT